MLVIGKQSSGKSTFLKILCFCRWMEKLIMWSDEEAISQYTHNLKFLKSMKQFHRFNDSYFSSASSIRYEGDTITITMENILSDVKILRKPEFETVRYNKWWWKRFGPTDWWELRWYRLIMLPVACSLPCLKVGETVCWLWLHTALIYFHFECSYSRGVCDGHEAKVWQIAEYSK